MIKRLLAGYVAIVLVLAGALAIPFGIVFAERQREQFAVALERDAVVVATIYEDALQHDLEVDPAPADAYAQRTGVRVVVVDASGGIVRGRCPCGIGLEGVWGSSDDGVQ